MRTRILVVSALAAVAVAALIGFGQFSHRRPFLERKSAHQTKLLREGSAPQKWRPTTPPDGVLAVEYDSGPRRLKAWLARPTGVAPNSPVPAVIYFHGGFAFGAEDWADAIPFLDAGYAVLAPTLRAENGNPGVFEYLYGEVDDGFAAATWLATQPGIDQQRIFGFGHSVGGGVSALLSLYGSPFRATGSAGGLYENAGLLRTAPFDTKADQELELRTLLANLNDMAVPHFAYVGEDDVYEQSVLRIIKEKHLDRSSKLRVATVPGNHFQSLRPAIDLFLSEIHSMNSLKEGVDERR